MCAAHIARVSSQEEHFESKVLNACRLVFEENFIGYDVCKCRTSRENATIVLVLKQRVLLISSFVTCFPKKAAFRRVESHSTMPFQKMLQTGAFCLACFLSLRLAKASLSIMAAWLQSCPSDEFLLWPCQLWREKANQMKSCGRLNQTGARRTMKSRHHPVSILEFRFFIYFFSLKIFFQEFFSQKGALLLCFCASFFFSFFFLQKRPL